MLLPGLVDALLGHLALRFLLQLRVEFLDQAVEALHFLVLGQPPICPSYPVYFAGTNTTFFVSKNSSV